MWHVNYRHVNKPLATDVYSLLRLEELVDQAAGHNSYATLDIRVFYFQIILDGNSRDFTASSDEVTLFRFRRLTFGQSCSPAIFTRHMAVLLSPLLKESWIKNYLDDLIIWVPDFTSLTQRLRKKFTLLEENDDKLNLSKCEMTKKEVTFLGYGISKEGSQADPKNVEAVF